MTAAAPICTVATHTGTAAGPARTLPEEAAVALVCNGSTLAVLMATPADLADFATGFCLTEAIAPLDEIGTPEEIRHPDGIELRLWLPAAREAALALRRRAMVGPVGCGLCGIDSLAGAARALPRLPEGGPLLSAAKATAALAALRAHQPLHDLTRAVHCAAFWASGRIVAAREDVGRHNALDKVIGALARARIGADSGVVLVASRLSIEMVQKTVMAGARVLLSVSAPTAAAVRLADAANLTLASLAGGALLAYSHAHRLSEVEHAA